MKRLMYLLLSVVLLVLPVPHAWGTVHRIVDVVPLDGKAVGINGSGLVTGTINLPGGVIRAFTWAAPTGFAYLDPLSGYTSSSSAGIDDSGHVAGYSKTSWPYTGVATLWGNGPASNIGTFNPTATNNVGQVLGRSDSYGALLWSENIGLEYIGIEAFGLGVNDDGVVVGQRDFQGFVWTRDAGIQDIYSPDPGMSIAAVAINNAEQVVCQTSSFSVGGLAYIWRGGSDFESLGVVPGTTWTSARDINNLGQVVGQSGNNQPFVWDSVDGIQALPLPTGFSMGSAVTINDGGLIAGYASGGGNSQHLVLWEPVPVPEPSSLLALAGGLAAMGIGWSRRKAYRS